MKPKILRRFNILVFLIFLGSHLPQSHSDTIKTPPPAFRFHSSIEPIAIDPAQLQEATGGFLFYNLFRGLMKLDRNGAPVPELASSCSFKSKNFKMVTCKLNTQKKFSDGSPIRAQHWVDSFRRIINPETGSLHSYLLLNLKNASSIISKALPIESLGVFAKDESTLIFDLENSDSEFLLKLASPVLTALKGFPPHKPEEFNQLISNGPYQIKGWESKSKITLKNNIYYNQHPRPDVEILIIQEDSTALQLFDLGRLDLLRRINANEARERSDSNELFKVKTFRFDYIGFGPELRKKTQLREALASSLQFEEVNKIYQTIGRVGCPSFPTAIADPWPCIQPNIKKANFIIQGELEFLKTHPIALYFSKSGGEEIQRGMEWIQNQWKKHLGISIEIKSLENSSYLHKLKFSTPDVFRKGVALDRPTCLAALELFKSDSSQNLLGLKSDELDRIIVKMQKTDQPGQKKKLCGAGLKILISEFNLIPQGEFEIPMLKRPEFKDWTISPHLQLDLSQLRYVGRSN